MCTPSIVVAGLLLYTGVTRHYKLLQAWLVCTEHSVVDWLVI